MSMDLYYTAPAQDVFDEIKEKATEIWSGYDDTYGYATEKIDRIKDIQNVSDNWMYMVAMFDINNQAKLFNLLRPETATLIKEAMS